MAPLTATQIRDIFLHLSEPGKSADFFAHVADDVDWTIKGHSPMSGVYTTKADFIAATLDVLGSDVLTGPLCMEVQNVIAGMATSASEGQEALVEMQAAEGTVCKNGLTYDMTYAWAVTFDASNKIVKVRAYLDTDLLTRAILENRKST